MYICIYLLFIIYTLQLQLQIINIHLHLPTPRYHLAITSPSPRYHLAMTYILYTHSNASSKLQSILFKSNIRPKSSYNVILSF